MKAIGLTILIITKMPLQKIRTATTADVSSIASIEAQCFPKAEAATLDTFNKRFAVFPDCFVVIEVNNKIAGHINGSINDVPELPDVLYQQAELHRPEGKFQTVMGLAVAPAFQKQGLASQLIKHFIEKSQQRNHAGMILTCKDHLIGFYEKHGFKNQGVSSSTHGGAQWYKMVYKY